MYKASLRRYVRAHFPGEVREWISNRPFVLTIGNAGGVAFELNGRPLPALGAKGAVIQRLVLPPESR